MKNDYKYEIRVHEIIYILKKGERYFFSKDDLGYIKRNGLIGKKCFIALSEKETQNRYADGGYARSSTVHRKAKLIKIKP